MNLYLCSTLRHFLFALLKSLNEIEQKSRIIVVTDQQGLDPESFDLSILPSTITVTFIGRKKLLKEIYSGGMGLIHKCFAVANYQNDFFKKRTANKLYESEILSEPFTSENTRLFLFNDRNRLSRLIRLAFPFYEVIEDGLSNYTGTELSFTDRFFCNKKGRRYIGDDRRCKFIHLLTPELAPSKIASKVQRIDFIDPNNVNTFLYSIFKLDHSNVVIPDVIIATQPISISGMNESGKDIDIYRKMAEYLEDQNCTYAFKVHPRENEDKYKNAFPSSKFIKSKVPLELLVFGSTSSPIVLSVYSSAGMGFEGFCHRITLITDNEAEMQAEIYNQWKESFLDLNKRLEAMF
ncbi:glycosyltransferase family 52 [Vibrio sp. 1CM24A]|uniref:glycosyltransferase family 52 n=1 Tax=Vibrio sp. 1CM24A TaxID=2929165 RepID=UPI0020BF2F14|nr:glycosyltransferase family 52 [Vibrio sp. 1CM24A]MCK8083456.1 alpha-2,8-polysialyltransferase family protein [Vibrio sp. 1CM24A]